MILNPSKRTLVSDPSFKKGAGPIHNDTISISNDQ